MDKRFLLIAALISIGQAYGMEEREPKKRKRIETEQEQREVLPVAKREELQETRFEQWQELPEEIQSLILSFVPEVTDYNSYARLLSMDPQFNKLVSDPVFFRAFATRIANFNPELAKKLLTEGAKANQGKLIEVLAGANDDLKKHAEQLLFDATSADNVKLTRTLLQAGVDPNVKNSEGRPILVRFSGIIPEKIVKLLIEHGVDVNARDKVNELTPLMFAAMSGNVKLAQQLIPHAELDIKNKQGQTILEMLNLDHTRSNPIELMAIAWMLDQEAKKRAQKE